MRTLRARDKTKRYQISRNRVVPEYMGIPGKVVSEISYNIIPTAENPVSGHGKERRTGLTKLTSTRLRFNRGKTGLKQVEGAASELYKNRGIEHRGHRKK